MPRAGQTEPYGTRASGDKEKISPQIYVMRLIISGRSIDSGEVRTAVAEWVEKLGGKAGEATVKIELMSEILRRKAFGGPLPPPTDR